MNISRSQLKNNARTLIRTSRPSLMAAALIFIVVSFLLEMLSGSVLGVNISNEEAQQYMNYYLSGNFEALVRLSDSMIPPATAYPLAILIRAVLYIFSAGFLIFIFNTVKKTGAVFGNLLDGFSLAGKLLLLALLIGLFMLLWMLPFLLFFALIVYFLSSLLSAGGPLAAFLEQAAASASSLDLNALLPAFLLSLLFNLFSLCVLLPLIYFSYRYRMGIYLLLDDPKRGVMECIRTGKQMIKGHKRHLFVLDLSFIGWRLLTLIPYIGAAVSVWTTPYIDTTYVLYYMALAGKPVSVDPAPEQNPYL